MKLATFWKRHVRVSDGAGGLLCPAPHREQARYIAWVDGRGPGLFESLCAWAKKTSKSFMGMVRGVHHLVADDHEPDDRLAGISSFDEQQSMIMFTQAVQMIDRDPHLRARVRVFRNELVYEEQARDPRTGGRFTRVHRLRALPRDTRGLHGEPWSLVIRDELWSEPDHTMSEALIPAPGRRRPEILYLSYAGLSTMQKPGVPLYDLLQRAKAGDPRLFYSYIGGTGDDASWRICPWISQDWIEAQRRVFAASPSRFRRVVLNETVASDGDQLLTFDELRDALDSSLPAVSVPHPGVRYRAALDLGVSNDHCALVIVHLDEDGKAVIDACQVWKPRPGVPVNLMDVEDHVIAWSRLFPLQRLDVDQWNAKLLVERLQRAGVPAKLVSVESAMLNRIVTVLKAGFARRAIRLRPTETYLLEQLEALKTVETRTPRRDFVKFAPSGTGLDASQHDDAAVALGLTLVDVADRLGRIVLSDMPHGCDLERWRPGAATNCYLASGPYAPTPAEKLCAQCAGHLSAMAHYARYVARGGHLDLAAWYHSGGVAPNAWASSMRMRRNLEGWL